MPSIVRNVTVLMLLSLLIAGVTYGSMPIVMLLIFTAATLGSVVNQSQDTVTPLHESFSHVEQIIYFAWKILVAMVFTLVLYLSFMSGLISGDLFPNFKGIEEPYTGTIDFLNNAKLLTNGDTAKMLVWAFIAGYSEKFVPNIIRRIEAGAAGT